jgi:hypothetical protein
MKCPQCGKDDPKAVKFCTSCGAPIPEQPTVVQRPPQQVQPTTVMPAAPPATATAFVPPTGPAAPVPPLPTKKKMKGSTKAWIAVACVVGVLVVAAAIAIPLVISAANKPVARVNSVKLLRTDGDTLDMDKVPLDTELSVKVDYNAKFKGSGSASLHVTVSDADGSNIIDKTYDVKSSASSQSKDLAFSMTVGSGKPLKAIAKVDVSQGAQKLTSTKTLSFTAVAGKGKALQYKEALAAATAKCREATDTLKNASAAGVNVNDLADKLSSALTALKASKTADEANAVTATAQSVIDEAGARVAAAKKKQQTAQQCKQNQATIRAKLVDWWSGTGNFPDSMSQLYGLPSCPDGGTYTYYAPDTTPATLHVSCSVHGEL